MKKSTLIITAALLVYGCTKTPEPVSSSTEPYLSKNPAKGIKKCLVTKVTSHDPSSAFVDEVATFTYTDKGLPHTITFDHPPATGYPDYEFVYDKNHKLSQFLELFSGGRNNYDAWHIYQYGKKGLIVSDTTYFWGSIEPGMTHPSQGFNYGILVHTYTYDKQRRITSVSEKMLPGENNPGDTATTYTYYRYNKEGNRGDNYSTALNINQTSDVFQFVNRDYSINSPVAPIEVNERNLPKKYEAPEGVYAVNLLRIYLDNSEIEYSCDEGRIN